jgi:hypothetical protein
MAGIAIEDAQAQLAIWIAANAMVATGQEYTIDTGNGQRTLKRVDAAEIRQQIVFWQNQVSNLASVAGGGRIRTRYVVPE